MNDMIEGIELMIYWSNHRRFVIFTISFTHQAEQQS